MPFHGGVRKIPLAEAPKLLGIALQDEHRRSELQRMQAELKAQSEQQAATLKVGQELANFARANPVAARALDSVYNALAEGRLTPEQVLSGLRSGEVAPDTNGAMAPTSAPSLDPRLGAELASVREELSGVKSALAANAEAERSRERKSKIDLALQADPFLRARPGVHDMARTLLEPHLANGLSIEQSVSLVATTMKDLATSQVTAERDRLAALSTLGSPPPSAGVPPVPAPDPTKLAPNLDPISRKKALKAQIVDNARGMIAGLGRAAASGPS